MYPEMDLLFWRYNFIGYDHVGAIHDQFAGIVSGLVDLDFFYPYTISNVLSFDRHSPNIAFLIQVWIKLKPYLL